MVRSSSFSFIDDTVQSNYIWVIGWYRSATAGAGGTPESPTVSSPSVDLDGTVQVGLRIAGSTSTTALSPVNGVDLPKSNISGSVGVVVEGISISSTFVWDDTFAACLVPWVFSTPGSNILHVFGGSAVAGGASAGGAVSSTWVSKHKGEQEGNGYPDLHSL